MINLRVESVQDVASVETAIGVFFAAFQLWDTGARANRAGSDSSELQRLIAEGFQTDLRRW